MELLLLGGYQFVGRAIIAAAQARGHHVTAFNRGNLPTMDGVEAIRGDRADPAALRGRHWDVAIDTSGYLPRNVRASAELLADAVERYIFVSSVSAYLDPRAAYDETARLKRFPSDRSPDTFDMELYGELKVLCEAAAEAAMPGRMLTVRPGFIVGPYDNTDRFNSWIERASRSEPMLVPGPGDAPLQLIDVRDLAEWIVTMAEQRRIGAYSATGPIDPLTVLGAAEACVAGTGSHGSVVVVDPEIARAAGIEPWKHVPFWFEPDDYGLMQANIAKAVGAGLRTRPLVDTVRDTYAWLRSSQHQRAIVCPAELERAAIGASLRGG